MRKVYLDHAATTPPDPVVWEAMARLAGEAWGNPSSGHHWGRRARALLDDSAERVAAAIGARRPDEILFTSGGTEADNLALRGVLATCPPEQALVISSVEHAAVDETAAALEAAGRPVRRLPVDARGLVDPARLDEELNRGDVALVSLIWANNELGGIHEMARLAAICRAHGVPFHSDAVQALGRLPVRVDELPVDLLSGSAHKFHGPKGAGFLYVRRGRELRPVQTGGLQAGGLRGGTENLPGAVGLGLAIERAEKERGELAPRLRLLAGHLLKRLEGTPGMRVVADGQAEHVLPGHLSLSFPGIEAEALLLSLDLDGVAVSSGSACHTGRLEPSHVLLAAGLDRRAAKGTLRVVLGRGTMEEDLDWAADCLRRHVERLGGAA